MTGLLHKGTEALARLPRRVRGLAWTVWIRAWGGEVGRRLEVDSRAVLRHPPGRGIRIGDDVYIGVGAIVDVHPGAELAIGDGVKIMHYVVIAAANSIRVGQASQLAEFTSVRDADHGLALGTLIRDQTVTAPVNIGTDVWIARSAAILRGVHVGDGAVVGANAVVRTDVPDLGIAVGVPARTVRIRE